MKKQIWFIADTHFNHENIIKYCNRPFKTIEEMNKTIVDNWNKTVHPRDTVFIIGDFAFKNKDDILNQLHGIKIFITGNHENELISSIFINYKGMNIQLCHNPDETELTYNICGHVHGKWLTREIIYNYDKSNSRIIYNCGVDINMFKPVNIETIYQRFKIFRKEHHDS